MNNNKIIFGIIIFCAISFLAFTFANPAEDDDTFIKDNQTNGTKVNNKVDNKDDEVEKPVKVDEVKKEDENKSTTTSTTSRPSTTTPSRPSTTTPSTPVVEAPKYTAITTTTSGVSYSQNGTNVVLSGEVPEIGITGAGRVELTLTSPEVYSEQTLENLEVIIVENNGATYHRNDLQNMYSGNGTDKAVIKIGLGVALQKEFNITVYWGTGERRTYKITLNINVKLNEIPEEPEEPEEPTPDPEPTPEVTE